MHTHATTDSPHSSHDRGDPFWAYIGVFAALMLLLFLTVGAYEIDFSKRYIGEHNLGWVNTAIALAIATFKTMLVVLFFMHLRHSTRLTWVVSASGFVFLCIMILFTFTDYNSRNVVSESVREASVAGQSGTHANGETLLKRDLANMNQTSNW